jgi:hypothetical protein
LNFFFVLFIILLRYSFSFYIHYNINSHKDGTFRKIFITKPLQVSIVTMDDNNNNNSSKQKRTMAKATSPGAVAVVEEEFLVASGPTATVEPAVLEPHTTTSTKISSKPQSDAKQKKRKNNRSMATKPGVIHEYDRSDDDDDEEDDTLTTHRPSDGVDVENGGTTTATTGVFTLEAHLVDEEEERRKWTEQQRQEKEDERIRRLEESIRNNYGRPSVVVDAVPLNKKNPWWQLGNNENNGDGNRGWSYDRKKVVVVVTIIGFVLVAIAGIVVIGVAFGSKESSTNCQETCKGLLTGTPVTVNGVEFEKAIVQYLKDPSSSPYGSVINCWDVSQVSPYNRNPSSSLCTILHTPKKWS